MSRKKCMKIVQDLPSNKEDLKFGGKQTDAFSLCLTHQKQTCAISSCSLEKSKWLHNLETDWYCAIAVFVNNRNVMRSSMLRSSFKWSHFHPYPCPPTPEAFRAWCMSISPEQSWILLFATFAVY